jgi:SAM-dependent methyltransferase
VSTSEDRVHTNRRRAESFGVGAELYDRVRPSYPPALIDDLVANRPAAVLDVGCGTGKAARLLAERGVSVLGVEIDERMADVARGSGIAVETGRFEDWDARGRRFDLVVCGQAWHWLDPDVAVEKVVALLPAGGLLAPFWNFTVLDTDVHRAIDAAYAQTAPQISGHSVIRGKGASTVPPTVADLRDTGAFASVEHRRYPWEKVYTRDEWLELIQTQSDHSILPAEQLAGLVEAVGAAIDSVGGAVAAHYTTEAVFARTR